MTRRCATPRSLSATNKADEAGDPPSISIHQSAIDLEAPPDRVRDSVLKASIRADAACWVTPQAKEGESPGTVSRSDNMMSTIPGPTPPWGNPINKLTIYIVLPHDASTHAIGPHSVSFLWPGYGELGCCGHGASLGARA
jgi:hypothetical protein